MVDLIGLALQIIITGIVGGIFVWLAAKALGSPQATYWHGILTVISAIILTYIISYFLSGLTGWIISAIELIVVLLLIKHFFNVGWLKAIVIAVLAVIIAIIIAVVLAVIGFTAGAAVIQGMVPTI